MDNKVTYKSLQNFILENKEVFKQKLKNKLKSTGMSEKDASDLINKNEEIVDNSYSNKENENKTAIKLKSKK